MKLDDYTNPNDPYAPRPKASQTVAAAKRQRREHNTAPATPAAPAPREARQYLPFSIGALIIIVLMVLMAAYQLARGTAQPLAIPPSPAAAAIVAVSTATLAPTPPPTIAPATHVVFAYAAPDGVLLGPVDLAGELVIAVGRAGAVWVQLERGDHSRVWFKRADLPANVAVPDTLPDLSPRAEPAPQTGQGLNGGDTGGWVPPEATAAPAEKAAPEPTATIVWATVGPVTAADFEKPDIRGTCQFIGCLGQNAVDLARAQACHALFWQYGDADPETIPEPDYSAVRACVWEGLYH